MAKKVDFLITGAGIIGVNVALELRHRHPNATIVVADKEAQPGFHASGRNSGVLHAGFYYPADSLKARFTREGNHTMTRYCLDRGLKINQCGKLVVAVTEKDLAGVELLLSRAQANGVELESLGLNEARKMEPALREPLAVLYSPSTASVDPKEVLAKMVEDALERRIEIRCHAPYRGRSQGGGVHIGNEVVDCGYFINAAGLYSDHIARDFGFSQTMAILPFKGLYLKYPLVSKSLRTHVYPVPDLNNPFLGVHYTLTVDGGLKIGPTALPALWREHYQGFSRFKATEMVEILARQARLFAQNHFGFRNLALQEMKKMRKQAMLELASALATPPGPEHVWHWGPAGIRAQLMRLTDHSLVMDFYHEGDHRSFHILNAVSPGFTCAIPFAHYLCEQIAGLLR